MWLVTIAETHHSDANLKQPSVGETILVTYVREPGDGVSPGSALLRHQRGDAVVGRMVIVKEESGGKDVRGSKVYLGFPRLLPRSRWLVSALDGSSWM